MKQILCTILFICALGAQAQHDGGAPKRRFDDAFMHADSLLLDSLDAAHDKAVTDTKSPMTETALPWNVPMGVGAYGMDGCDPYFGGTYAPDWRLHEGLNAQFSLSVSAGIGKHAPKGVGFGQSAAFAYLFPVTDRLSFAAGIYASNMDWGRWRQTDVGMAGILAYRVNENINVYAYGAKTFMPRQNPFHFRHDPFPLPWDQPRDRIGAAAEFKIGKNAMIGVSVEHRSY